MPTSPSSPAIALLPGLFGFDRFFVWQMYRGVKPLLEERGFVVLQPLPDPIASIESRARLVAAQIDVACSPDAPLHLIGHSMGGLDARFIASPSGLGWGGRVRSVTTLVTPHRGSPAADALPVFFQRLIRFSSRLASPLIPLSKERAFTKKIGVKDWPAIENLSPRYLNETFNPTIIDDPRVRYFSYGAVLDNCTTGFALKARRLQGMVAGMTGNDHDGLVPVASAKWGEYRGTCTTDHSGIIGLHPVPGWKIPFDHLALFAEIADYLAALPNN